MSSDLPLSESRRCWKLPDGQCLIACGAVPWPTGGIGPIRLPDGKIIYHATMYCVFTPQGRITAVYPLPRADSFGGILYLGDLHEVVGDQFCRLLWEQQWRGWSQELIEEVTMQTVVFDGLVKCNFNELPFDLPYTDA